MLAPALPQEGCGGFDGVSKSPIPGREICGVNGCMLGCMIGTDGCMVGTDGDIVEKEML